MTTLTHTVYAYAVKHSWETEWSLRTCDSSTMENVSDETSQWVLIGPRSFTVELPAAEDLLAGQVKTLNAAKQKIRAEAQSAITKIEETIQSLLALPDSRHVVE